jgi:maltose O-acetyltransferase
MSYPARIPHSSDRDADHLDDAAVSRRGPIVKALRALTVIARDVVVNGMLASPLVPGPLRGVLLRAYGIDCRTPKVSPRCFFGGKDISIGRGSFINYGCFLDGYASIRIGERCAFAPEVMLVTSTHHISGPAERAGAKYGGPIVIGDGCWLGARVSVMPGVTIGDGCIIAAGAVVTSDCEANSLYAGVPATRKRALPTPG